MPGYTGTDNLEVMADAINYNDFLLSLIRNNVLAGKRILDFGAGIATFSKALTAEGFNICCLEPDAKQAQLIKVAGLPVATSLEEIDDSSIDFIYSLNVLEHIEGDVITLKALHDKLQPDGRILIYVPAFQILYSSMDRKVGHFRRYKKRDLIEKMHAAEFTVTSACYIDSLGFFASLLFRLVGDSSGNVNRKALIFYDRLIFPLSRWCDSFCGPFFGKNVVVIAEKASGSCKTHSAIWEKT